MGKVLGQISTGGGGAQLEEQLSAIDCPSMRSQTYTHIQESLGDMLERVVTSEHLAAGEEEKRIAMEKKNISSRCTCHNSSCRCWMEQT